MHSKPGHTSIESCMVYPPIPVKIWLKYGLNKVHQRLKQDNCILTSEKPIISKGGEFELIICTETKSLGSEALTNITQTSK